MKLYGKAESAAERILDTFKSGRIPKALAPVFIHRKDHSPCRSWSNQMLTALAGFDDARGYLGRRESGAMTPSSSLLSTE